MNRLCNLISCKTSKISREIDIKTGLSIQARRDMLQIFVQTYNGNENRPKTWILIDNVVVNMEGKVNTYVLVSVKTIANNNLAREDLDKQLNDNFNCDPNA